MQGLEEGKTVLRTYLIHKFRIVAVLREECSLAKIVPTHGGKVQQVCPLVINHISYITVNTCVVVATYDVTRNVIRVPIADSF